jgi:ATP-dependent RNA helicase RhlE
MTFEDLNLNKFLLEALADQEISTPTEIQEKAIPVASSGKDIVGIAQTGTGKTLAYLLPILKTLKFSDQRNPRVLILVPTRELVVQVVREIELLTPRISVRALGIYGGTNINTQKQLVHDGSDIIVATPGRIYDIALTGILRFSSIQKLVIDECDEMLNLGFLPQLQRIMELLPQKRQNMLFSATITEHVSDLIDNYFDEVVKIEIGRTGKPLEKIDQYFYLAPNFYTKLNFLKSLVADKETFRRFFVFVRNKKYADIIFEALSQIHPNEFGVIHSNKSQNFRIRMLDEFQDGKLRGIIATDVASRGVDIEKVSHVVNLDIPEIAELYIHRIGRTGRKEMAGETITMITEDEVPALEGVFQLMGKSYPIDALPEDIEISIQLNEEEKPKNIHDAPTLLTRYKKRVVIKESSSKKPQKRSGVTKKKRK